MTKTLATTLCNRCAWVLVGINIFSLTIFLRFHLVFNRSIIFFEKRVKLHFSESGIVLPARPNPACTTPESSQHNHLIRGVNGVEITQHDAARLELSVVIIRSSSSPLFSSANVRALVVAERTDLGGGEEVALAEVGGGCAGCDVIERSVHGEVVQ